MGQPQTNSRTTQQKKLEYSTSQQAEQTIVQTNFDQGLTKVSHCVMNKKEDRSAEGRVVKFKRAILHLHKEQNLHKLFNSCTFVPL